MSARAHRAPPACVTPGMLTLGTLALGTLTFVFLGGVLLVGVFLGGCGLGIVDNLSGGDSHLPTQGAGPYGKLPLDIETPINEPIVLRVFQTDVREPSPLWHEDGGFRLWFGYEEDPDRSEIWYIELPVITEFPEEPERQAVIGDQPWEQDWVGAPSVLDLGADHLVMFYEGGRSPRSIGRADSFDNGATWEKHAANPLLVDWAQPGGAFVEASGESTSDPDRLASPWLLYGTRTGRDGIFLAESEDGVSFTYLEEPVLTPRLGREGAYDRYSVSSPHVVVRAVEGGGYHYGMFFNATASSDPEESVSIGWAGSFDGSRWQRFASPDEPVLAPEGISEHSPAVLLSADRGIMFYNEEAQGVQAIAAAMHP